MVNIYLKSEATPGPKGPVYSLIIRDSNGHSGNNKHKAKVPSGSKVRWELDEESGIKAITGINVVNPAAKLFKSGPNPVSGQIKYEANVVTSSVVMEEKYYIEYIPEGEVVPVKIDPFIRVIPPKAID
jgi:hypothetical protein